MGHNSLLACIGLDNLAGTDVLGGPFGGGIHLSTVLSETAASLRAVRGGLQAPGFYFILLLSLVVWAAAYQYKSSYVIDVGGPLDDAYVTGFNAKEPDPTLGMPNSTPPYNYRWTGSSAKVVFTGIGNQP